MSYLEKLCCVLMSACMLLPASGTAKEAEGSGTQEFKAPVVRPGQEAAGSEVRLKLPNGLSLYLIRDTRFPLVATRLYVRTGSTNEEPAQYGISHVLEHMVFKGTESRPKGQIARDIEALGGYLNAYTSFDKTCYLTDMPSRHWKTGIDVVRDMAFHPALDAKELESEKPVIVSELEGNEDKPSHRLFEDMQAASLANTPYAHPIIGTRETVMAVTPETLRAYIARWYQPQNMVLVVAGDINLKDVQAYVEETFGELKDSATLPTFERLALRDAAGGDRVKVVRGAWNKVYLGLSFAVPGLRDMTSLDLDVLSYLLAGDGTSLFERRYRQEKQLVDAIAVSNMSFTRAGLFTVTATLDADKVQAFYSQLIKDLAGLGMKAFTDKELARAKFNLEDSYDRSSETLNGLASWRALMEFELGGREGEQNIREAQRRIGFAQIAKTYAQWIRPERVRVRVLAPEKAELPDFGAILDRDWPATKKAGSETAQAQTGQHELVDLGDGRTLVLIPDTTVPYMAMTLVQAGGNALVGAADQGLDTLAATLLTTGAGKMDRQAIERYLAERAAGISAQAGLQTFTVTATAPARFTRDIFELVKTVLQKPRFGAEELKKEARNLKAAYERRRDVPMKFLLSKLPPFLFGEHPYGYDSLGTPANMDRFTREHVASYWKKQTAQPWSLAVSGTFDREEVLAFAASLARPSAPGAKVKAPGWTKEKALALHMDAKNQAHLMLLFPTVPRTHPDAPALMLLQSVLSGQSGLLFRDMRDEQGLGYTVTAVNRFMPEAGYMLFYIGTVPAKVDAARKGFETIIADIKARPLPKELLEAGANSLEGDYVRGRQSLASRSGEAAIEAALGNPQGFARELIDRTRALTPEDVRKVAGKYLNGGYEVTLTP